MHVLRIRDKLNQNIFIISIIYKMAEKQVKKILNFVGDNPELMQNMTKLPELAKSIISPSGITGAAPLSQNVNVSLQDVGSVENVTTSLASLSYFIKIQNIIIVVLIVWAISIILTRFLVQKEETKKDVEFINSTLFGSIGIIPLIACLWLVGILAVTLVPVTVGVLPKIGNLSGALTNFLTEFITQLPALLM